MHQATWLLVAGVSLLRVCGQEEPPRPQVSAASVAAPALQPEHGGRVAVSGGLVTEVAAEPNGTLVAYVRDPAGAPVEAHAVQLALRSPEGRSQPVAVTYDPARRAYVGRAAGVQPGEYAVEVSVQPTEAAPGVLSHPPRVPRPPPPRPPPPPHGGRVEVVGEYAVETVAARNGDVAVFWTNLDGEPVPPAEVALPSVTVTVDGRPHVVPTRVVDDHFVAHVDAAPGAAVLVAMPGVVVRGVRYSYVAVPDVVVVAALPVVVVAPAVVAPAVVVAPTPAVVVTPPVIYVGHGHGRGRGRGRGHGHGRYYYGPMIRFR
jgi:hypothetical protein